jgi:hypothetical protein
MCLTTNKIIFSFDVRGLLEFPIDFKRATEKREGNILDEGTQLYTHRFGDLFAEIDHGTSNPQKKQFPFNYADIAP